MFSPHTPIRATLARACAALAVCLPALAVACETPVYRFALYSPRWAPWPYVVFHIHGGEAGQEAEVQAKLKQLVAAKQELINLSFESIDGSNADALKPLPPAVQRLWNERKEKIPLDVVVNPAGQIVFAGQLAVADVAALVDSPVRREMAKLLGEGHLVVVLLDGKRPEDNAAAEKTIADVVQKVNAGKLEDLRPADDPAPGLVPEPAKKDSAATLAKKKPAPADPKKLQATLLKVSRSDPAEAWLVRMLMRADKDLDPLADQPMAFWIYGRARAFPPLVGKGITEENLVGDLRLLTGPCTCEIKDQNPGMDLLTTTDWKEVAEQMRRLFGEEPGGEELDITSLVPRLDLTPPDLSALQPTAAAASQPAAGHDQSRSRDAAELATSRGGSKVLRYVGIGLGGALLLLLLATVPLLRRGSKS
jgi:hypothetical protein